MARSKNNCRHTLEECLVVYHYGATSTHESFETVKHTERCKKCGFISNKVFECDLVKKRFADTDKYRLSLISSEELLERYKDLPRFYISGDK